MMPMILTVYLSNNEQGLTEVPITPETTCRDVIEFCKEPGEIGCHLAEVWRGNERAIPPEHMMYEHLQKWGPRKEEVKFFLRHEDSPNENSEQNARQSQDQLNRWNGINLSTDKRFENGGGNPRVELTLSELQEMASRQQHQIEAQQQMLVAKEQRLRYLKQQERRQQQSISESDKLQKLKERMESQEAKLKKIRAMRGQVDYSKIINGNLSAEIEHINDMFHEKQRELQSAVLKVDQLTQQLDDLRKGKTNGLQAYNGQVPGPAAIELKKLYQELQIRNKLNQEQNTKLQHQKELLNKRNVEVTMMDKRISELRERLWKKKSDARQKENIPQLNRVNGTPPQTHSNTSGRVAAVGPYIQVSTATRPEGNESSPGEVLKPQSLTTSSNGSCAMMRAKSANDGNWPAHSQGSVTTGKLPTTANNDWKESNMDTVLKPGAGSSQALSTSSAISSNEKMVGIETGKIPPSVSSAVKQLPQSYGSHSKSSLMTIATPPKNYQQAAYNTLNKTHTVKAMYGKPVLPSGSGSASPSPLPFAHNQPFQSSHPPTSDENQTSTEKDLEHENLPPANSNVENIPRPLSPTKLLPIVHSPLRYQSDADLEALRKKLAHAPRPLKKRSSITEPEGPSGPNIQKLLYQRFNTLAGGMDNMPFYLPSNQQDYVGALADVDNGNTSLVESGSVQPEPPTLPEVQPSSDANDNQLPSPHSELIQTDDNEISATIEDNNNNPAVVQTEQLPSPKPEVMSPEEDVPPPPAVPLPPPIKRTNFKKPDSERTGCGMRVKFDPLALLLDAALEGEFDLVQRIIYEVNDPSRPNDEGITPLHNAVCAGHHHIVKFLVDFGVNANAADSDGWTPLHCAASCNSVQLCKLLVESGAAIFATTISDVETAADKCEEMEEGFVQCSQFLYGVQEKMGVMNKGVVYALWDYEAKNSDELSFHEGDPLTVVRRKDDNETDWWWARLNDKEGYVPRNLLGLYPRIKPRQRSLA
ncbi:hypothetical protein scyTo_0012936 [Scyliorhinus torazame]|uniref:SH3 domain-containing protein n=1 Tax=Scyliorhinus torazame TaxID=75743 RepID=A0A401NL32_SCYTO|nr:hypothetical protein [Scyliorhinus torazame]